MKAWADASRQAQAQVNVPDPISKACKAVISGRLAHPAHTGRRNFRTTLSWGCALRASPQAVTSPAFSLEHRRCAETYSTENSEGPRPR